MKHKDRWKHLHQRGTGLDGGREVQVSSVWFRQSKEEKKHFPLQEKGKSFITNAQIHRNKRFVINVDLENFFDSFHFGRVRGYFMKNKNYQCSEEVATTIAQIACYEGKLPQGAPSSPIITNMICNIFDMRLLRLAKKYKLDYTRYADDLSFSTNDKNLWILKNSSSKN